MSMKHRTPVAVALPAVKRFAPTAEEAAAYYAGKARLEEQAAETAARLKAARFMRKVERLTEQGWTVEAAVAHLEGTCDLYLCTSADHDSER